jgi:hypothetical protein
VEAYKGIAHFKAGRHHMYIQAKRDPDQQWLSRRYRLTKDEVGRLWKTGKKNGKPQYQKWSHQKHKSEKETEPEMRNKKKKNMKEKEMAQEKHRRQYHALERRGKSMIRGNQYTNGRRGKHSRKWPPRP